MAVSFLSDCWKYFADSTVVGQKPSGLIRRNVPLSTSDCSLSWRTAGPGSILENNTHSSS